MGYLRRKSGFVCDRIVNFNGAIAGEGSLERSRSALCITNTVDCLSVLALANTVSWVNSSVATIALLLAISVVDTLAHRISYLSWSALIVNYLLAV